MTASGRAGEVLAAILEADPQAVFLVDPALRVWRANSRADALLSAGRLFQSDGERLAGRTRRVNLQLVEAISETRRAPCDAPPPPFLAWGKPRYTVQLRRLELAGDPLVMVRVFEGYASPDASGEVALHLADRGEIRSTAGFRRTASTDPRRPNAGGLFLPCSRFWRSKPMRDGAR